MNKVSFILSALFIVVSYTASAQVAITTTGRHAENKGVVFVDFVGYDITNPENSKPEIIELRREQKYKGHIALIEFGFNNFTKPQPTFQDGAMDLNMAKSIYVGWNLVTFAFPLNKSNTLGISTAFGLVWRNFVMENNYVLTNTGGVLLPTPIDPSYKKSKYNTFSFKIPVVLEYDLGRHFFVSAGVYADILVSSQTKIKDPKEKHKGDLYSNPIGAGVTMRAGYKRFYLFGDVGLVNVFDKDHAPKTKPWTIGVGLGF